MHLLLHICCGVCLGGPLEDLVKRGARVEGFFYNPNIHPYAEFKQRMEAVRTVAQSARLQVRYEESYGLEDFLREVMPNDERRCERCYRLRLRRTAQAARETGCDAIQFIGGHSLMGLMPFSQVPDLVAKGKEFLIERNSEWSIYNEKDELKNPASLCKWLWNQAAINWNGSVSPCSGVFPEKYDFGNCFETSLMDVWNNDAFQKAREAVKQAETGSYLAPGGSTNVCELCARTHNYVDGVGLSRMPAVFLNEL